jgi:hypothetical protein
MSQAAAGAIRAASAPHAAASALRSSSQRQHSGTPPVAAVKAEPGTQVGSQVHLCTMRRACRTHTRFSGFCMRAACCSTVLVCVGTVLSMVFALKPLQQSSVVECRRAPPLILPAAGQRQVAALRTSCPLRWASWRGCSRVSRCASWCRCSPPAAAMVRPLGKCCAAGELHLPQGMHSTVSLLVGA